MDPSQPYQGAPAEWHSRGASDDIPVNNAEVGTADRSRVPFRHAKPAGALVPTLPSPEPDIHYRPQYRNIAPALTGSYQHGHPLTPPRHDEDTEYSKLHQWYSQEQQVAPAPAQPQESQSYYVSPFTLPNHDILQTSFTQPQCTPSGAPPRLHPSANLLNSSPSQPQVNRSPPPSLPPASPSIQQWPTHNLRVDEKTRKKQETYRQKGEAKRRQSVSAQSSVVPQYVPVPTSASTPRKKRKVGFTNTLVSPTPPPSLRHGWMYQQQSLVPGYHPQLQQQTNTSTTTAGHPPYQVPYHLQVYPQNTGMRMPRPSLHTPQIPQPVPPPPNPLNPEQVHQPITSNYEGYKWPVKLYELNTNLQKCIDSAHTLVEHVMEQSIHFSEKYRWHAHTSPGFIQDGNRHSVIVLHNAANPFTWGTEPVISSTSIGVYGRYAHGHNEIRWTTISPGWPGTTMNDHFTLKQTWLPDMKPTERRFHRAYWLAANMFPLKDLMNHSLSPGPVYNAPEDDNIFDFEISEDDLQSSWEGEQIDDGKARKIWQKLLDEVDGYEVEQLGTRYTVIGGSERVHTAAD